MTVHSHQKDQPQRAQFRPGAPEFARHVVTAVLVAHDGARWLPKALSGLHSQERPVQNVIAADTGSADESARILEDDLGKERVLYLARRSGFGTAVEEAVRTAGPVDVSTLGYFTPRTSGWDAESHAWIDDDEADDQPLPDPVQWIWLLHDDCEPSPDALTHLLSVADSSPSIAVVGPKLRSWFDSRHLLEAGVTIARSGRRWTGLDRKEQDQGQHDQVRQTLSVSSAGMLVRRDVWEELGGFDRRLPLMRDDVDFCWRVQSAGYRVMVAPDATMRHAEAAARERRPIDCSVNRPHRVDKAGAAYTLLVNTPLARLPYVVLRILIGTLLRTFGYLVAKVPGQALDEIAGLIGVLLRPERILAGRRRRAGAQVEPSELRPLFPPPGATIRLTAEQVVSNLGGGSADAEASAGRHGAVESGPGDEDADFLELENFARLKRIARKPAPVLFTLLLIVSLIANRGLFSGGSLAGGAMLPSPGGASDLWGRVTDSWHAIGTGGTSSAPPYLAVLAVLATVLFGKVGLAVAVLLVGSVPLAGLTAYFAARPLVASPVLRAWASLAYALLPATTGALATGRIGTATAAVLLPLMARAAAVAFGLQLRPPAVARGVRPGWRALWALTLLLTVTMAFTPILWPVAAVLCVVALGTRVAMKQRQLLVPLALRSALLLGVPLLLLAPWSPGLLGHPSRMLLEAGLPYAEGSAGASDLLLLNPGGPGALSAGFAVGVLLAGLGALLRPERRTAVVAAWAAALTGLLFALPMNGTKVTASAGLASGTAWAGPVMLVYSLGLIAAAVVGAEGIRGRIEGLSFGWRQPVALLIGVAAIAAPVLAGAGWLLRGAGDPLDRRDPTQVPAFVAEESTTRDQARTLVLSGDSRSDVSFMLVRGSGARLGDAELSAGDGGDGRLGGVVNNLLAGSGADQAGRLAGYAVRYVLVQKGKEQAKLSQVLDSTPGILRVSQENGTALWRVDRQVSRITVQDKDGGNQVSVGAGPVAAHASVPSGADGRVLRVADTADSGWQATLDGRKLTPTTVDGWAQGFELPAKGGTLDLVHETPFSHTLWTWLQGLLALVVLVLALPGRRTEMDDDMPEPETAGAAPTPVEPSPDAPPSGEGRRARRLRAQAEAEQALAQDGAPAPDQDDFEAPDAPPVPAQQTGAHDSDAPADGTDPAGAAPDPAGADPQGQGGEAPAWDAFAPAGADPYATGQYPAAPAYTPDGYPQGQYQGADQYAADQYQQDQGYQPDQYQPDQYPQQGQYATGEYGGYPAAPAYPAGQDGYGTDGGYAPPADYGQYPQQQAPYYGEDGQAYPQGQYADQYGYTPEGYPQGQYPDPAAPADDGTGEPDQYGETHGRDGSEQ